jgi:tight adherence protein C
METVYTSILFLAFATALFSFGAAIMVPASGVAARLRTLLGRETPRTRKPVMRERLEQALYPISRVLPRSPGEVSRVRAQLMQAGYREGYHLTLFLTLKVLLPVLFFAIAVVSGLATRNTLFAVLAPLVGFMLPSSILKRKIRGRQDRIRLGLPDALDLCVICIEAGLGLDQSLRRVGQELSHAHPELSEEFSLLDLEIRAGKTRPEALRNLANRTGVDDVRALVAVLVQTDRFGTSIAHALRVHSDSLRTQRRQRAEEKAAKTTVKMVPVLVFFLFPAMFLVSLGPMAINAMRNVFPAVQR